MLVEEVESLRQLQLVDLEGELQKDVALVYGFANSFGVHAPVIDAAVEAAEAGAWWAADNDVRLLLLDYSFGLRSGGPVRSHRRWYILEALQAGWSCRRGWVVCRLLRSRQLLHNLLIRDLHLLAG